MPWTYKEIRYRIKTRALLRKWEGPTKREVNADKRLPDGHPDKKNLILGKLVETWSDAVAEAMFWYWRAKEASPTLLYYSHGMQPEAARLPDSKERFAPERASGATPKSYAFLVPFGKALFNPHLTLPENKDTLIRVVKKFSRFQDRFISQMPFLFTYPYDANSQSPPIEDALERLARENLCDIVLFRGLANVAARSEELAGHKQAEIPVVSFLHLHDLIAQSASTPYPLDRYDSYLLAACRTSDKDGVGMGTAPGEKSGALEGLFRTDNDRFIVSIGPETPIDIRDAFAPVPETLSARLALAPGPFRVRTEWIPEPNLARLRINTQRATSVGAAGQDDALEKNSQRATSIGSRSPNN